MVSTNQLIIIKISFHFTSRLSFSFSFNAIRGHRDVHGQFPKVGKILKNYVSTERVNTNPSG